MSPEDDCEAEATESPPSGPDAGSGRVVPGQGDPPSRDPYRGARKGSGRRARPEAGMISDTREVWVDMPKFSAIMFTGHNEDWVKWKGDERLGNYDPELPPIRIEFRFPGRRNPTSFNLTAMTAPELQAFRDFMEVAFDRAKPIVEVLDRKAQEAYDNGDDSYARLYRPIPQLFVRKRLLDQYGESVPGRPEGAVGFSAGEGPKFLHDLAEERARRAHPANGGSGGVGGGVSDGGEDGVVDQHPE